MRVTLSLLAAAALLAGGTAVLMAAPAAHAIKCPPGTEEKDVTVGDATATVCVPFVHCDPAACDLGALPRG